MLIVLSIIHYGVCIFLIVVILLQAGRGHGLTGSGFGGEGSQSLFGTRTTAFMTKVTTVSAIAFIVTSLSMGILTSVKSKSLLLDSKKLPTIPTLPLEPGAEKPAVTRTVKTITKEDGTKETVVEETVSEEGGTPGVTVTRFEEVDVSTEQE